MDGATRITDDSGARALASRLNAGQHTRPVVVVTTPAGRDEPYIDVDQICADVGDIAEIVIITTGPHTWTFSSAMPDLTQVYGGAGRVYPVGTDWVGDVRKSPLRFAYSAQDGPQATTQLVADAERMAAAAGLFDRKVTASPPVHFTGQVIGFPHPERALVKSGSELATVIPDLAQPGVPLERLLTKGMQVSGAYDRQTKRLDIRGQRLQSQAALAAYVDGSVILARVVTVTADEALFELFPEVSVTVGRDAVTSNDLDSLDDLLSEGEVLLARVVRGAPDWQITLIDVDDDEPRLPAASVFAGGPEWLEETGHELPEVTAEPVPALVEPEEIDLDDLQPAEPEPAPEPEVAPPPPGPPRPSPWLLDRHRPRPAPRPAAPTPAASAPASPARPDKGVVRDLSLTVAALKQRSEKQSVEIADLTNERNQLSHRLRQTESELGRREAEVARLRGQLRKAGKRPRDEAPGARFADREAGFRHAVLTAWATRTPVGEQGERPLADYLIGPDFLASLDRLEGISESKVVDVVFEIATDRVKDMPGRDLHQLRQSAAGGSGYVRRQSDDATCWRAALQVNTPSARRIHYWIKPGGQIELSRVCLHDDMDP